MLAAVPYASTDGYALHGLLSVSACWFAIPYASCMPFSALSIHKVLCPMQWQSAVPYEDWCAQLGVHSKP
eukprot:1114302-Pelagomonas_calceolata.AAC.4